MQCPRPQVLRQPHRTPLHACPNLRRIKQRSLTNSFAVPRKHRRQRLLRPRPVRLRPIDGPHASSKHTSVRKAFTEMHLRQKRQVDGPSFLPGSPGFRRPATMNIALGEKITDKPFCHPTQRTSLWPTAILIIAKGNAHGTRTPQHSFGQRP